MEAIKRERSQTSFSSIKNLLHHFMGLYHGINPTQNTSKLGAFA